jgi:hypothetical protein
MMLGAGCGKVENAIDCHSVCDRYKSCYDSSYDVDGCAQKCRDNSSNDSSFQQKADECDACIGDKSCASATFNCATQCAGIVP